MAKKTSKIEQQRLDVAKQERAVAAKIARTKKKTGADVAGTGFDVRRPKTKTRSYNSKQLQTYSKQLSGFMDRNKQFTVDANNQVSTMGEARLYKVLESRFNNQVKRELAAVAHLSLPRSDGTILDRMSEMVRDRMGRAAPVNVAIQPPVRDVRSITSAKAMKTLTDDYRKRLTPEFQAARLAKDRESFVNSLREAGMDFTNTNGENIVDMVNVLTDKQFATVWKYTPLAGKVFLNYESMKNSFSGEGDTLSDEDIDGGFDEVKELLTWAQLL